MRRGDRGCARIARPARRSVAGAADARRPLRAPLGATDVFARAARRRRASAMRCAGAMRRPRHPVAAPRDRAADGRVPRDLRPDHRRAVRPGGPARLVGALGRRALQPADRVHLLAVEPSLVRGRSGWGAGASDRAGRRKRSGDRPGPHECVRRCGHRYRRARDSARLSSTWRSARTPRATLSSPRGYTRHAR